MNKSSGTLGGREFSTVLPMLYKKAKPDQEQINLAVSRKRNGVIESSRAGVVSKKAFVRQTSFTVTVEKKTLVVQERMERVSGSHRL
jgi:hypothetical protein